MWRAAVLDTGILDPRDGRGIRHVSQKPLEVTELETPLLETMSLRLQIYGENGEKREQK